MLFRFSLYGFLKNQRYFEPFLVLALLEKGLSFFQIGFLIALREITCILLEVPSGAIADVCGRRGSMILSFAAYLLSFLTFGLASSLPFLLPAMVLYGVGDAFRTGTHKAMIFAWLRQQGREHERTRVYGFTRSWSKLGSAFSGLVAAAFVFYLDSYNPIFFAAAVPCVLSIINFLGYPKSLEGSGAGQRSPGEILRHMRNVLRRAASDRQQRRLIQESMGFEGTYEAARDYLQPVLALAALSLVLGSSSSLSEVQRTAILVGPIYTVLFLLSAFASRKSHVVVARSGGHVAAARRLWFAYLGLFLMLCAGALLGQLWLLICGFVGLYVAQNLWRPILISRFDACAEEADGATTLSLESLARRAATMVLAPLLGLAVDQSSISGGSAGSFLPVGVMGLITGLIFLWSAPTRGTEPEQTR